MTEFRLKRIYAEAEPGDGYRVLVDRLWPRGVSKQKAQLDEWCKDVAPSPELRTWFGHQHERFTEFAERYRAELDAQPAAVGRGAPAQARARTTGTKRRRAGVAPGLSGAPISARTVGSVSSPKSSAIRDGNTAPHMLTMRLVSSVVTISRRNGCTAMSAANAFCSAGGKYAANTAAGVPNVAESH